MAKASTTSIDLTQILRDFAGQPVRQGDANSPEATLGHVLLTGVRTPMEGDTEHAKLFKLGLKLSGESCELSADEVTLALARVEKLPWSVVIWGRCVEILDPSRLK
jgi:hypothetical protein